MSHAKNTAEAGPFDDLAVSIDDDATHVEPGEYRARVVACRRQWRFGRELLVFSFQLVTRGPFYGAVLPGYCNLAVNGQHIRAIPARSKLGRWVKILREFDPSISTGRVPLHTFSGYEFKVQVALSQFDHKRRPVPPYLQTATVQDILRVVEKSQNAKKRAEKKTLLSSSPLSPPLHGGTT